MSELSALRTALDLMHMPSRVRALRREPLPAGTSILVRIVGGDDTALATAIAVTGRDGAELKRAATFFAEQILLAPGSDSYRVLGCDPAAPAADLRRNMALLSRWLHPDAGASGGAGVYASRLTGAWEDVKTPERRASYDATRSPRRRLSKRRAKPPLKPANGARTNAARGGLLARAARFLFGGSKDNNSRPRERR